jgi:phosphatidylglycerophosphate synthase
VPLVVVRVVRHMLPPPSTAHESLASCLQVNSLGKWKTALQMVSMSLLLVLRNADHLWGEAEPSPQCEAAAVPCCALSIFLP